MSHKEQVDSLVKSIDEFARAHGQELIGKMEVAATPLLAWIQFLQMYKTTKVADELLIGSAAAIREASAMVAIGAVRPALFSLRAEIDLLLGWLYFKDHPVEYALVQRTGDGFKLKKDVLNYLKESLPGYGEKIGVLAQLPPNGGDPYRLLSAHIHAQAKLVVPLVTDLKDVIFDAKVASECVDLQRDVADFLSDLLFATGIVGHSSLPPVLVDRIRRRNPSVGQNLVLFG